MKRNHKRTILIYCVACAALLALSAFMAVADDPEYVGAGKCKFCHKDQYAHWQETKHAKAFDALKAEDQKNEKCIKCHVTGHGKPAAAGADLEGVQCEACHGPGSLFKNPTKIMNKKKWKEDPEGQRKLAKEAGLIVPGKEVCIGCHNEESPTFKGFDFEERIKEVRHPKQEGCE